MSNKGITEEEARRRLVRRKGPSDFTRLLNAFEGSDPFTIKVIQRVLTAQRRLNCHQMLMEDIYGWVTLEHADLMDVGQDDALAVWEDHDRKIQEVVKTLNLMRSVAKDIIAVRFSEVKMPRKCRCQ
jgi:hypothetical protein